VRCGAASGGRAPRREAPRAGVMSERPKPDRVVVLGVGMHPWGKWGRSFAEYGVVAARRALADAGLDWSDVDYLAAGNTMRNGYPGYVAGSTMAHARGP